jgi:hypothetical protein
VSCRLSLAESLPSLASSTTASEASVISISLRAHQVKWTVGTPEINMPAILPGLRSRRSTGNKKPLAPSERMVFKYDFLDLMVRIITNYQAKSTPIQNIFHAIDVRHLANGREEILSLLDVVVFISCPV